MRRIIERTVTVVTTTTWKISWEPDIPSEVAENPALVETPHPIEGKAEEVDLPEENAPDLL